MLWLSNEIKTKTKNAQEIKSDESDLQLVPNLYRLKKVKDTVFEPYDSLVKCFCSKII